MSKIIITATSITSKGLSCFSTQPIEFWIINTLQTFCWLIALIRWSLYMRSRNTYFFIVYFIIFFIRINLIYLINLLKFLIYFDLMYFTLLVCDNGTLFIIWPLLMYRLLLDGLMLNLRSFNWYNLLGKVGNNLFFHLFLFFMNIFWFWYIFYIHRFYLFIVVTLFILPYFD